MRRRSKREDLMEKIGFIGIGLMGSQMARHLLDEGYPMVVWNRTAEKARPLLEAGAGWADSPREVAKLSEIVITMVTDSSASEEVAFGHSCLLYTSDAADDLLCVDLGG